MLDKSHRLVVLLLLVSLLISADGRPNLKKDLKELKELKELKGLKGSLNKLCEPDRLTVYRVILNTFWNDKTFPKHFPQWRPPAQWSKLVGKLCSCVSVVLSLLAEIRPYLWAHLNVRWRQPRTIYSMAYGIVVSRPSQDVSGGST